MGGKNELLGKKTPPDLQRLSFLKVAPSMGFEPMIFALKGQCLDGNNSPCDPKKRFNYKHFSHAVSVIV